MEQVRYWAPSNPKGGDEQKDIANIWCNTLIKLGFVCV